MSDDPYRGTVIVIQETEWRRPRLTDIPLLVVLWFNCLVAGVLLSGGT